MSNVNKITLFIPEHDPKVYDLDAMSHPAPFGSGVLGGEVRAVLLGRGEYNNKWDAGNDIAVPKSFETVSRAHCVFFYEDGRWFIRDDGSTNGLYYQGRRIRQLELHDGDKVYISASDTLQCALLFTSRPNEEGETVDSFPLHGRKQVVMGRAPDCDIVLKHPTASRRHCVITQENGGYFINDLNSTNGVLLNGNLLEKKTRLQQMDKISIADMTMFFSDNCLFFHEPKGGVGVSAVDLMKKVGKKGKEKLITNGVSLSIRPNEFVAIVGGSGAGKTTLLDCLSGMTDFTGGEVLVNGESIRSSGRSVRSLIGYVPQKDIVYEMLTLERMLYHSARLRMPKDTSPEEINEKINETLEMVELEEHKNTLISKLSGGQRKRASIAVELLASPKLFFLDEPSSGLDPGTEKNLMRMLKRLSDSGKTVIVVTHTVQNIDLCDRLVCMGKGGLLCYAGPPAGAADFFGKQRLTDIYEDLNENAEEMSEKWRNQANLLDSGEIADLSGGPPAKKKQLGVLARQYSVLTARYAEILKNNWSRLLLLLLMPVVLAILVCLAYQADGGLYQKLGIQHIRETFPFLVAKDTSAFVSAFSSAVFWIGIFNSIQEISKERTIYERERFTGVSVVPYALSKFTVLAILTLVQSAVMTELLWVLARTVATVNAAVVLPTDMAFGLTRQGVFFNGGMFWVELYLTTMLCAMSAMCLGLAVSALVSNDIALVLCPICLLPQILFSGVATQLSGMTKMLSKIITCRWGCIGYLTSVDLNSMVTSCEFNQGKWELGETALDAAYDVGTPYLFGLNPVASAWIALGALSVGFVLITMLILQFKRRQSR